MIEVWEMSEMMNKENLSLEDNTVLQMLETSGNFEVAPCDGQINFEEVRHKKCILVHLCKVCCRQYQQEL